jgi:hypothetical protein
LNALTALAEVEDPTRSSCGAQTLMSVAIWSPNSSANRTTASDRTVPPAATAAATADEDVSEPSCTLSTSSGRRLPSASSAADADEAADAPKGTPPWRLGGRADEDEDTDEVTLTVDPWRKREKAEDWCCQRSTGLLFPAAEQCKNGKRSKLPITSDTILV